MNYFIYREGSLYAANVAMSMVTDTRIAGRCIFFRSARGNANKIPRLICCSLASQ